MKNTNAGSHGDRLNAILERLKERGHRITPQRLAILGVLADSTGHPSAEQIHRKILPDYPTTSLATVYKTIALLKEVDEVLELQFSELGNRYDGAKPYPHPHVICTQCGEVVDPEALDFNKLAQRMAEETGFDIVTHRLDFFGICPACQAKR